MTTKARYTQILSSFCKWYGEPLGVTVRVPHKLPEYVEDKDVEALLQAIRTKCTHKRSAARDTLIVELALHTGLRRAELANLRVGDIHLDQGTLVVRNGKGGKDAYLPLNATISARLGAYITPDMTSEQRLFGLKPASISSKIERFARKAGVDIHCHTFRHVFGTKLTQCRFVMEQGIGIEFNNA